MKDTPDEQGCEEEMLLDASGQNYMTNLTRSEPNQVKWNVISVYLGGSIVSPRQKFHNPNIIAFDRDENKMVIVG